jgi:thiol-disulfide isomerase/thioredoxin
MKRYLWILLLFILPSAASAQVVHISGVIHHFTKDSLELSYQPYALLSTTTKIKIPIQKDGKFDFKLNITEPVRAFTILSTRPVEEKFSVPLETGGDRSVSTSTNRSEILYLYLAPGDDLWIETDADEVHQHLLMKGSAAHNSHYLMADDALFNTYKDRHLRNYFGYVNYGPAFYKNEVIKRRNARQSLLDLHQSRAPLSPHLYTLSQAQIEGDAFQSLLAYPNQRSTYTQTTYTAPEAYYDFMQEIRLPESMQDLGISYVYFVDQYLKTQHKRLAPQEDFAQFVKGHLKGAILYEYAAWSLGNSIDNSFLALFEKSNPYKQLSKQIQKKYHPKALLKLRKQALQATLEDINGQNLRLQDLKGQLVYIDFWATWCVPCIEEIPHLERLQEIFKGQNIKFVSISLDKAADKGKWSQFVKERQLKGVQVWAGTKSAATLKKALLIHSIPRFVLIDEKGNFLDVQATRPSESATEKRLASLLQQP